jgi:hypothetical protein
VGSGGPRPVGVLARGYSRTAQNLLRTLTSSIRAESQNVSGGLEAWDNSFGRSHELYVMEELGSMCDGCWGLVPHLMMVGSTIYR